MGSAGIDPRNLIVKPVTADGLHEKDVRSAEKSVRSRSTHIGEQGCAASGEPMLWHENSSI